MIVAFLVGCLLGLALGFAWCWRVRLTRLPEGWRWAEGRAGYVLYDTHGLPRARVYEERTSSRWRPDGYRYRVPLSGTVHRTPETAMRRATRAVVR